jgi:hypothetical protein
MIMSKEISCRHSVAVLKAIKDNNIPQETWLREIPYSPEHLNDIYERIEWSVLCQIIKNIRPYFTDENFTEIGRTWVKCSVSR